MSQKMLTIRGKFLLSFPVGEAVLHVFRNDERDHEKFEIQAELLNHPPVRLMFRHNDLEPILSMYGKILKDLGDGSPEDIQKFEVKYFSLRF